MIEILKEKSDLAIKNGNEFQGFLGVSTADLSKEELIMVCNVLYDKMETERLEAREFRKNLLM